jgi:transposase
MSKVRFLGLDVHADTIAVAVAEENGTVRSIGTIPNRLESVRKLVHKLGPAKELCACYEAGPTGYVLYWQLSALGVRCEVVAPTLVPTKAGDRVKTDRRDAEQLARLFRAGELTAIHVPDPQDEAVRDLLRARYQVSRQQHRARQQLKMFLLRQNFRYAGKKAWTPAHLRYLATVKLPFAEQQFLFQEMVNVISEAGQRLKRYEKLLPGVVAGWRWEPVVKALMSLRGVALLTATILVAELGDWHRFETAGQLMSYLGLVPSEDTTGGDRKQGGLTKMGNGYARRALIEAAWNYRTPARISRTLLARQEGLPKAVVEAAWTAQTRLHARFKHLTRVRHKKSTVAAAALGRELAGFIWAIARMVQPHPAKPTAPKS